MNKHLRKCVAAAVLLVLLGSLAAPAFAEERAADLVIRTEEEFLDFARNCRLDAFSRGMTVSLEADLDLSGMDFSGIPTFSGTFLGNSHLISGLDLTPQGSVQGLFRYLTGDAVVKDLTVHATVIPEGSRRQTGGIVGSNSGTVSNCIFAGEVAGSECIGGIAGSNQVSGVIESCQTSGNVHGGHFVGGIAGENFGLIRSCENRAEINTTAVQNDVMVSDITTDTIMGTESAETVTDLGGIAGTSTGVIRNCENRAAVGYQHMGYNIGGIAGSQRGLIAGCRNYGIVSGRKEVAGIVGQLEPVARIEFTDDALQILRDQLADTSALADRAASNMHSSSQELSSQMSALHHQADTAADAIRQLLPQKEQPHFPDADTVLAARNTLTGALSSMESTLNGITEQSLSGVGTAVSDIRAVTGQINAMSETLDHASEHLGGKVTDVSDLDTEQDCTAKVLECENLSAIDGDLNVGGIAGTVAWENDLDPEDDYQVSGRESLNFNSELRAVILRCSNHADIQVKKKNAGGIAGNLTMGLVRECSNTGAVCGENAQDLGGIAGTSTGFLRSCSARCQLNGKQCIGGIAGSAVIVSDCRSLAGLPETGERLGAVIGTAAETERGGEVAIRDNYFLPIDTLGAIDGISYAGFAEPLEQEEFLALDGLSDIFDRACLRFVYDSGEVESMRIPLGQSPEKLPAVPERENTIGHWDRDEELDQVYFDMELRPEYTASHSVIESSECRPDGKPVLLAEGHFIGMDSFPLQILEQLPEPEPQNTALEGWILPDFGEQQPHQLRCAIPQECSADRAGVQIQRGDGTWYEPDASISGSYLVFPCEPGDRAFCIIEKPILEQNQLMTLGIGASAVMAVGVFLMIRHHKKKKISSGMKEKSV